MENASAGEIMFIVRAGIVVEFRAGHFSPADLDAKSAWLLFVHESKHVIRSVFRRAENKQAKIWFAGNLVVASAQ
jgi:hypothetical protein